jgi:hypothetical protein
MLYIHLAIEGSNISLDSSGCTLGYTQDHSILVHGPKHIGKDSTGLTPDMNSSADVGHIRVLDIPQHATTRNYDEQKCSLPTYFDTSCVATFPAKHSIAFPSGRSRFLRPITA